MLEAVKSLPVQVRCSYDRAGKVEAQSGPRGSEVLLRARNGAADEDRRQARRAWTQLQPGPRAPTARSGRAYADERPRRAPLLRRLERDRDRRPPRDPWPRPA